MHDDVGDPEVRRPTAAATKITKVTKITKKNKLVFVIFVSFVIFVPPPWRVSALVTPTP